MSNYAKAYKILIKQGESIEDLSKANHIALDAGKITIKEFTEAAEILAMEILKR